MARRISSLTPGESVILRFATHDGYRDEPMTFIRLLNDGQDAEFQSFASTDYPSYIWSAYKFNGRWCYGTSAQRLSVL